MKYILGAGSSGLVAHFYDQDSKVISDNIGGQARFSLGPRNVFVDNCSKKFMNDLRWSPKIITKTFGFFYNDELHSKISKDLKKQLIQKKLQDCKHKIKDIKLNDVFLGDDKNYIEVFDVSFSDLIEALKKKLSKKDFIKKEITLVDLKNKSIVTKDFDRYSFDSLISTIPMPQFRYLCFNTNFNRDFLYIPVTFAFCDKLPAIMRKDNDYDLIYVPELKFKFHRISKIDEKYVYEFSGDLSKEEIRSYLDSDVKILSYVLQRVGIIYGKPMIDTKDVMYLGRLSQWDSNIRLENVIKKVIECQ